MKRDERYQQTERKLEQMLARMRCNAVATSGNTLVQDRNALQKQQQAILQKVQKGALSLAKCAQDLNITIDMIKRALGTPPPLPQHLLKILHALTKLCPPEQKMRTSTEQHIDQEREQSKKTREIGQHKNWWRL